MKEAVALEESIDKHPVTPGPVLPARELQGDLLMALGRPAEALAAYEASLAVAPNRFYALGAAVRAADAAGRRDTARAHFATLEKVAARADGSRTDLAKLQRDRGRQAIGAGACAPPLVPALVAAALQRRLRAGGGAPRRPGHLRRPGAGDHDSADRRLAAEEPRAAHQRDPGRGGRAAVPHARGEGEPAGRRVLGRGPRALPRERGPLRAPRRARKRPPLKAAIRDKKWHPWTRNVLHLAVNTRRVPDDLPRSFKDLADPKWASRGRIGMSQPRDLRHGVHVRARAGQRTRLGLHGGGPEARPADRQLGDELQVAEGRRGRGRLHLREDAPRLRGRGGAPEAGGRARKGSSSRRTGAA